MLLLSALNGVAMVAIAVVLFANLSEGPDVDLLQRAAQVSDRLGQVHDLALSAEAPPSLEDILVRLDPLERSLRDAGAPGSEAMHALDSYRSAVRIWDGAGRPDAGPAMDGLQAAHRRLVGELYLMAPYAEYQQVDRAAAILPWIVGWTLLVAAVTVYLSLRMRSVLSTPLERMAAAAQRVSQGSLDAPIPDPGGSPEFAALASAMESMRGNLTSYIAALDEQNHEMKTMLGALGDGVLFLDEGGRVMEYNPQARNILDGLPTSGALLAEGITLREAFPQLPATLFAEATEREVQLPITLYDDDKRHIAVRVFPVTQERTGYRKVYVAVVRDITESVAIEQLKRDFLSVVTHELKTPLTAIDGFVRLLLMEKAGPLTPRQRKALETVRDQSGALRQMVQDLLDATRLEGGNLKLDPAVVGVRAFTEEVAQSFQPGAEARGLTLTSSTSSVADARIRVDDFRLRQVVGNLIQNAFKFTPEGGTIHVEARLEGEDVELSVADTGRGIPTDALPRLFRKFYQVQRGDTRVAGGTGLGLYICRQLTQAMGGTIRVDSTVGEGSRFTLTFPRVDALDQEIAS
ncbi:MAG: HAMP domain-containing protein [Alphaproteobacteria bacterium]|nr:HAMP domain-containing protein [Alphaproteobacteria bacterium]